jgi:hypothetical protein
MGQRVIPETRLFIYGRPVRPDPHGQCYVIFGFKLGDATVVTEDGRVLIGPVQRISFN